MLPLVVAALVALKPQVHHARVSPGVSFMRLSGTAGPIKEVLRNVEVATLFEQLVDAHQAAEPEAAELLLKQSGSVLLQPYRAQSIQPRASTRCMLALENERLDMAANSQGKHAVAARQLMRKHVIKEMERATDS